MGLLSIFQRNKQAAAAQAPKGRGAKSAARQAPLANAQNPADAAEAMREVRARARTRLMGATVLLLIGVIGFPLLFETQPRPIPVDLPIEIPARNAANPGDASSHPAGRVMPSAAPLAASVPTPESVSYDARPASMSASAPASAAAPHSAFASLAAALTSSSAHPNDTPASAAYVAPSTSGASSTVAQAKPAKPVKVAASAPVAASKPSLHTAGPVLPPPVADAKPSPAAILADTAAAKPSDATANGGRFVVQVGAFLDDAKVHEARTKVEKLGLKTYTQPVDTPTGKRIRVRIGPYATKAEADKIATKLKADGLTAVVLVL